ncbi:hypothetical protein RYX36_026405 [Vicia faba]
MSVSSLSVVAMVNTDSIRTLIGIIGWCTKTSFPILPHFKDLPTFIKIWKAKSVQDFKPDPYVVTILNCAMWSFYGMPFISESNTLVVTINGFGFFLEIVYTSIFFIYSTANKRKKISLALLAEAVFLLLVIFIVMYFIDNQKHRNLIVGFICIIFNILMYFSPLTVMVRLVIQCFWFCIIATTVPNGLGAISGLAQLILYGIYYRSTKWDEELPSNINMV